MKWIIHENQKKSKEVCCTLEGETIIEKEKKMIAMKSNEKKKQEN